MELRSHKGAIEIIAVDHADTFLHEDGFRIIKRRELQMPPESYDLYIVAALPPFPLPFQAASVIPKIPRGSFEADKVFEIPIKHKDHAHCSFLKGSICNALIARCEVRDLIVTNTDVMLGSVAVTDVVSYGDYQLVQCLGKQIRLVNAVLQSEDLPIADRNPLPTWGGSACSPKLARVYVDGLVRIFNAICRKKAISIGSAYWHFDKSYGLQINDPKRGKFNAPFRRLDSLTNITNLVMMMEMRQVFIGSKALRSIATR